ncbi:MAG: UDP-N-acetylglucosamine 2-epimerase (non-hydrolyzing) [Bacteroidales bacterium]|nr:UDP-N-acetylglucosamine 2-epimerase (non-hydrolyzing) [Bacteroidales bacterium]
MRITIVAGARPNFMKIAPLIRSIEKDKELGKDISYRLIYTGKQDDLSIDATLFYDLQIKGPDNYLGIDCKDPIEQIAQIMIEFNKELKQNPAHIVLVVDDLSATMSCSIVAKKQGCKVAHLVAGTRSFNMDMPKELNRLITDGLSNYLFTAGTTANRNLDYTGTEREKVFHVGNILIDNIRYNRSRIKKPIWFDLLKLQEKQFILLTLNRRDLISQNNTFSNLIKSIIETARNIPIVAPLHGYVQQAIESLKIECNTLHLLPPQSYLNFIYLIDQAKVIITDSGNVAEEATFLGTPCITVNDYAEHPETWRLGTNVLVGENPVKLKQKLTEALNNEWKQGVLPERWDGRTAERILQILKDNPQ